MTSFRQKTVLLDRQTLEKFQISDFNYQHIHVHYAQIAKQRLFWEYLGPPQPRRSNLTSALKSVASNYLLIHVLIDLMAVSSGHRSFPTASEIKFWPQIYNQYPQLHVLMVSWSQVKMVGEPHKTIIRTQPTHRPVKTSNGKTTCARRRGRNALRRVDAMISHLLRFYLESNFLPSVCPLFPVADLTNCPSCHRQARRTRCS